MSLRDLIASPGEALVGQFMTEWRMDPDGARALIDAIDAAVKDEREACAKIAEEAAQSWNGEHGRSVAYTIRDAIRARRNGI